MPITPPSTPSPPEFFVSVSVSVSVEVGPGPGEILLVLLTGILSGATSVLSLTGSTIAVRPDAPRQPGLLFPVNAVAAGSVSLILRPPSVGPALATLFDLLSGGCRCLSFSAFVGLGVCEAIVLMPRPLAYSTGFTWLGLPLLLVVTSPVIGSHRGFFCPRGLSPSLLVVRGLEGGTVACEPSCDRILDAAASASRCARRSRRLIGMLERGLSCGGLDTARSRSGS